MKYVNNTRTGRPNRTASLASEVPFVVATTSSNTTAVVGTILEVNASGGVKTITPPAGVAGQSFIVGKVDASANKVTVTGLGDIAFQNTFIRFTYGTAWRAS